jgi:hypothetical protein
MPPTSKLFQIGSRLSTIGIALLLCMLAACGASGDTRSPAEVHTAWIDALRANDRQAAQALLADDTTVGVDQALEQAQYLVTLAVPQTGRLQSVDVEAPVVQGAGQVGRSIWRLERLTSCFHTTIAETPAGWRVTGFVERQTNCPQS